MEISEYDFLNTCIAVLAAVRRRYETYVLVILSEVEIGRASCRERV